jgi:hypothetical protein
MATLDETNIFGLTPEQPEKKDDSLSRLGISESGYLNRLAQIQQMNLQGQTDMSEARSARGAEKKVLRDQYFSDLAEAAKDPTQEKRDTALESFFETPFMFQMGQYIPDPTGLPTDIAEAEYSGRKFKESREARGKGTEFYPGPLGFEDRPFYPDMTPEEAGLLLQQGLAIASIPPGIGGIAGIAQSMIGLPSKVLRSKSMDGTGGGGISNIQPQPTRDYAGFISSVEKTALGPQKFGTGQDLITYLESPKRSGISTKELEYIDFDQIRNNPDLTKEDVIAHIQANRPKVYRIERSEDNPTYQADSSDNPLNELPFNEEASRIANLEKQAYFRDEYAQEIADHNEILTNNPTLQNSNFVLNSENINDPSVLDDLERYLKTEPEAYSKTNPTIVKYTKPDGTTGTGAYESYVSIMDFPDKFDELIKLAKDGATIEFPALTRNADDILEEASAMRVSPDYGNQFEIYEAVGDNTSSIYKITGYDYTGYQVYVDGEPVRGDLGTRGREDIRYFDDLADARARVQAEALDNGDIMESDNSIDYGSNANRMIDSLPSEVISGQATLRTRFGDEYSDYRLPMGGAENYREFTLHIENPKTATRYDSSKGTKHFGGGDELLHYRVTDRIDEDGKRVLFVEEIQSDLHSTASSTKSDATYEIGVDTKKKAVKELRDIFKDNNNLRVSDNGDIIKLDADSTYDTNGLLSAEEVANMNYFERLTDLSSNINLRKIGDLSDAEVSSLTKFKEKYAKDKKILPDLPYKGNDYIDLAVKDIMKLAAEGNYDRVAFTNPATQLRRNSKNLEYIDSIEVNQVPLLTPSEQSFSMDWMRNRDLSMISSMSPNAER